jgi:hypothetical protein
MADTGGTACNFSAVDSLRGTAAGAVGVEETAGLLLAVAKSFSLVWGSVNGERTKSVAVRRIAKDRSNSVR